MFADTKGITWTLIGEVGDRCLLSFQFGLGRDLDQLQHQVLKDEALAQAVFNLTGSAIAEEYMVSSADLFQLYFPEGRLNLEGLQAVITAAQRLFSSVPQRSTLCWGCWKVPADLSRIQGQTLRFCPECVRRLAQQPAPPPSPVVAFEPTPANLDKFEQRYLEDPESYVRSLMVWVVVGQLTVALSSAIWLLLISSGVSFVLVSAWFSVELFHVANDHWFGVQWWRLFAISLLFGGGAVGLLITLALKKIEPTNAEPSPPEAVDRSLYPELYEQVSSLSKLLGVPAPKTLLVPGFTAAAVEHRRSWLVWEPQLLLGRGLVCVLTTEELRAVIAHELAHLHHNDSKMAWILRTSTSISRSTSVEVFGPLSFFSRWFVPQFQRRAAVLRQAMEFAADKVSVTINTADSLALALLKTTTAKQLSPTLFTTGILKELEDGREKRPNQWLAAGWSAQKQLVTQTWQLAATQPANHTHPPVSARMQRLGVHCPAAPSALPTHFPPLEEEEANKLWADVHFEFERRNREISWLNSCPLSNTIEVRLGILNKENARLEEALRHFLSASQQNTEHFFARHQAVSVALSLDKPEIVRHLIEPLARSEQLPEVLFAAHARSQLKDPLLNCTLLRAESLANTQDEKRAIKTLRSQVPAKKS